MDAPEFPDKIGEQLRRGGGNEEGES